MKHSVCTKIFQISYTADKELLHLNHLLMLTIHKAFFMSVLEW